MKLLTILYTAAAIFLASICFSQSLFGHTLWALFDALLAGYFAVRAVELFLDR